MLNIWNSAWTVGWSDFHYFVIFENGHIALDWLYLGSHNSLVQYDMCPSFFFFINHSTLTDCVAFFVPSIQILPILSTFFSMRYCRVMWGGGVQLCLTFLQSTTMFKNSSIQESFSELIDKHKSKSLSHQCVSVLRIQVNKQPKKDTFFNLCTK